MIFYRKKLMPTEAEITLFSVMTSKALAEFSDHKSAIIARLKALIQEAKQSGENPQMLIEDYLMADCEHCCSAEDISWFLGESNPMQFAFNLLAENWNSFDFFTNQMQEDKNSSATQQALQIYLQTDLRTYLEALDTLYKI